MIVYLDKLDICFCLTCCLASHEHCIELWHVWLAFVGFCSLSFAVERFLFGWVIFAFALFLLVFSIFGFGRFTMFFFVPLILWLWKVLGEAQATSPQGTLLFLVLLSLWFPLFCGSWALA